MARPNCFIVGAPKCGTTAWVEYLGSHPAIHFSPRKEPHYHATDLPGFRWVTDEAAYERLFDGAGDARIVAEASVQYLHSHEAAANIASYAPDARIIAFLRDRAAFLPSYHNQLVVNLDEDEADFERVWRASLSGERELPETCREPRLLDYPAVGAFAAQIERYLEAFPSNRVMVVRFEEWVRDPRATYLALLAFLGVDDDGRNEFQPVHGAKHNRSHQVARLTQRPPAWALAGARTLRRLLGRERLGVAGTLRRVNRAAGYGASVSPELKEEIRRYYEADDARLERLLERTVRVDAAAS